MKPIRRANPTGNVCHILPLGLRQLILDKPFPIYTDLFLAVRVYKSVGGINLLDPVSYTHLDVYKRQSV